MFQQSCEQQKNIPFTEDSTMFYNHQEKKKGGEYLIWKSKSSCVTSLGVLWKQANDFSWNLLQMIALVMDSFTDTDIFKDLLEACSQRQVKAYILLDQSSFSHFLKMCKDLGVDLEQEKVSHIYRRRELILVWLKSLNYQKKKLLRLLSQFKMCLCSSSSFLEDLTLLA